jgi:PAS domain-containing protein
MSETVSILRPQDVGLGLLFERIREGMIVADVESGRSKERVRTLISNAPVLLYVVDREGTYLFCDGQGLRSMGLESQQVVGRCIFAQEQERPYVNVVYGLGAGLWTKERRRS